MAGSRRRDLSTSARPGAAAGQRAPLRARRPADPEHRDPLDIVRAIAMSPRARSSRSPRRRRRNSRERTATIAGGELVDPRARPARRAGADPRLATSTSSICSTRRRARSRDGAKPLGADRLFQPPGAAALSRRLSVPTAAGPLYDVDTRLRPAGRARACWRCRLDAFAAYQRERSLDLGAYGAVPGAAGASVPTPAGRSSTRRSAPMLGAAARCRQDRAPTRPRCEPTWRSTSRRPGRSTSSSARAGSSTSNSPSMSLQLTHGIGFDPRLEVCDRGARRCRALIDTQADTDLRLLTPDAGDACGWSRPTAASRRRNRGALVADGLRLSRLGRAACGASTRRGKGSRRSGQRIKGERA